MAAGNSLPPLATILNTVEIPDKEWYLELLKDGTPQELVLKTAFKSLERERQTEREKSEREREVRERERQK
ncbi:hypothetical protein HK101_006775, partial [Irineochytrium annulatum]